MKQQTQHQCNGHHHHEGCHHHADAAVQQGNCTHDCCQEHPQEQEACHKGQDSCDCEEHHHHDGEGCGCHEHHHGDDGCGCGHDHGTSKESKASLILLGLSGVLFLAGLFFTASPMIGMGLFLTATLLAGFPLFVDGVKALFKLKLDEMTLLTIAVVAAFVIGEYAEAVLVTILFRIGQLLESKAVQKSKRDIKALIDIRPDTANLLTDTGEMVQTPAKEIQIDSVIMIKSGEKVPLDCVVLEGSSHIDNSALTGESAAVGVTEGDHLLSGAINIGGVLRCKVTKGFEDSAASRIIQMVEESALKKGTTETLISRFAKVYTPIVVVLAILLAVVPPLFGMGDFTQWISRALVFLVASCPCALVISIPLSFFSGIGASTKAGVLVKGTKYIEILAKADTVVFDKTGTITTGKLTVSHVETLDPGEDVLRLAAIAESYSNHPIAKAVVESVDSVSTDMVENCKEITGMGIQMTYAGQEILCGSNKLMNEFSVDISGLAQANIYVAKNKKVIGYIVLSDVPREDAQTTIRQLKELGVKNTVMLSGDSEFAAKIVKEQVGLDAMYAQLLPADKVSHMEKLKQNSQGALFVGDGINDAPVLAMADAGIAMGIGSDAAIEAADVVLLADKLSSLPKAIEISRRTLSVAKFNIIFALLIKAVVLVLGATGYGTMWMAVFADVGVTVLAVLNATRLMTIK